MNKRFSMTYGKYHDNLTKKEYDEKLESWKVCDLLNSLWEQTQRFEKQFRDMDQEAFHKALKKLLVKKCECGAELPQYPYYSETHKIYTCPACGKTYRITRRGLR